jgi:hypothetical protein
LWLLDGVLQLQPAMFASGSSGLSGMLKGAAAGNPHLVAMTIRWNASLVGGHPVLLNMGFALIQLLLGIGIAWRITTKIALGASIAWSVGVWWFGEGLGGILNGSATPIGGGPGAALIYALLAVLLWPRRSATAMTASFVAARSIGVRSAKVVWAAFWAAMAVLTVLGSGRSAQETAQLLGPAGSGDPRWVLALDHRSEAILAHEGLLVALILAATFAIVAAGPSLTIFAARVALTLAIAVVALVWIVGQNFGQLLTGNATDPNSGPLLALLIMMYWPQSQRASLPGPKGRLRPASSAPPRPCPI